MSKFKKSLKWIAILLVSVVVIAAIAFKLYTKDYYRADNTIISYVQNLFDSEVHSYSDENGTVFIPQTKDISAVIVFYPGGKVEYTAYSSLMYDLASKGCLCLLPKMPENLAILRVNAADVLTKNYDTQKEMVKNVDWYLAGHSLGGVAAASFLSECVANDETPGEDPFEYKGIILCASFPSVDLSNSDLRLLSIYGSNDGVLNMEKYEASKVNWPKDSEEHIIEGGIHSYFGNYGLQDGDGTPSISNEEQIIETADTIMDWIGIYQQ
ncbi:MAG: alpha/beta hydrolase [Butyrivibrio sp.]|nr:alpha/beta hydrolase [Butyrivibrio sp.]